LLQGDGGGRPERRRVAPGDAGAPQAISILGLLALCAGYMWLVQRKEKA
jgi:hypothetical protein